MSADPFATVTVPAAPLAATAAWHAAVDAAGGQCSCTGACGRSHRAFPAHRCPHRLAANGSRLLLAGDGRVYCPRCFDPIARASRRAAQERAAAASAARYAQDDLLSLLEL